MFSSGEQMKFGFFSKTPSLVHSEINFVPSDKTLTVAKFGLKLLTNYESPPAQPGFQIY